MRIAPHLKAIKRAESDYWREIDRIAEEVRREIINPYCAAHGGLIFLSGDGTYYFGKPLSQGSTESQDIDPETLPVSLQ